MEGQDTHTKSSRGSIGIKCEEKPRRHKERMPTRRHSNRVRCISFIPERERTCFASSLRALARSASALPDGRRSSRQQTYSEELVGNDAGNWGKKTRKKPLGETRRHPTPLTLAWASSLYTRLMALRR
eukprot:GHVT01084240.1.p1 GENE.GHVT01084240.1~~GHVT01084240.1.p1  ORF type:complete len:128 (-),score=10.17 GHVT01084240.1:485-868(-)